MIKFNGALIMALTLVFPAVAPAAMRAEANSVPPYWEGIDASGVMIAGGGQCPIVVEKELLTVHIPEFPKCGGTAEDYASYAATVSANYTFYNPEEYDVSAKLLFPTGAVPAYAPESVISALPSVTVNGEQAEFCVRHTYRDGEFDTDEDMALVTEGLRADAFYREDLPVTNYTVDVAVPEEEGSVYFQLTLDCNPLRTRLILENYPIVSVKNGYASLTYRLPKGGQKLSFLVAGEDVSVVSQKLIKQKTDSEPLGTGSIAVERGSVTSFGETVREQYRAEYAISETDWYNGYVDMLNSASIRKNINYIACGCEISEADFMRWYEYELKVPAKGRAVNVVTAPLFPAIDGTSNPRYVYTYLLSPAQKWAEFRHIDIQIETAFHLESSTLDFEKDGETYRFGRDALPQGELVFTLTETENLATGATPFSPSRLMPRMQRTILILAAVAVLAVAITAVSLVCVKERRKDKKAASAAPKQDGSDDKEKKE